MKTTVTLAQGDAEPIAFLDALTDLLVAGVRMANTAGVDLRFKSSDVEQLARWGRAFSDAADRLAAAQVNAAARKRRDIVHAVADAVDPRPRTSLFGARR